MSAFRNSLRDDAMRARYDQAIDEAAQVLANARARRDALFAAGGAEAVAEAAWVPGGPSKAQIAALYMKLRAEAIAAAGGGPVRRERRLGPLRAVLVEPDDSCEPGRMRSVTTRASRLCRRRCLTKLGVLIALGGGASAVFQRAGDARDRRRFAPPGDLIDIGGRKLHLLRAGSGSPAVVVVTAMADNVLMWIRIQRKLAGDTQVCLYDRAGTGWSDPPPPGRRTFGSMACELHALLAAARIPPPYVLVGHSIGGIVARQFAVRYPGTVSGIVLIDSSHEDQARRHGVDGWPHGRRDLLARAGKRQAQVLGIRRIAAALGVARQLDADIAREVPAEFAAPARAITVSSRQRRIHVREILVFARSSGLPPALGSLPLAVVTAGKQAPGWPRMQEELASLSTETTHLIAEGAGHYVHLDDPELVVRVIRDVVRQASR